MGVQIQSHSQWDPWSMRWEYDYRHDPNTPPEDVRSVNNLEPLAFFCSSPLKLNPKLAICSNCSIAMRPSKYWKSAFFKYSELSTVLCTSFALAICAYFTRICPNSKSFLLCSSFDSLCNSWSRLQCCHQIIRRVNTNVIFLRSRYLRTHSARV